MNLTGRAEAGHVLAEVFVLEVFDSTYLRTVMMAAMYFILVKMVVAVNSKV
jgi:hypothetical protein